MEFILGCNYWASNAGADMWRKFDIDTVRGDLEALSAHGVTHIRVFPNWRDFQPVAPLLSGRGVFERLSFEGDVPADNPYFLDENMLGRFGQMLDICGEYGIKVIVGLVTGWMSGRLYIPSALYGKNVLCDPMALYLEQLFIRGFVSRFRERKEILAWDLGNECNCMGNADRIEAVNWTAIVSNAIRAEDPTRPIVSGMHGISVDPTAPWQIRDQAAWTDILTTHPYPYWCAYTRNDKTLSLRTTMHATAESKLYAECGGRPCLAEEIGTMGPMLSSDSAAADFLRVNLFSLYANGAAGVMWWCGHDQTELSAFPYSDNMVEVELGLLRNDMTPKPALLEIGKFREFLDKNAPSLPEARTDAVCLLTHGQRQWGIAYVTHILARQSGLNLRFAYADDGIPEAEVYLLPSVSGIRVMDSLRFKELKAKVREGARLYISLDNGVLSELSELTGMEIQDSYEAPEAHRFTLKGNSYEIPSKRTFILKSVGAEVLACDEGGNPVLSRYAYGKGEVTLLSLPLEDSLVDAHDGFCSDKHGLYKSLFGDLTEAQDVRISGEGVCYTVHGDRGADTLYVIAVNHSEKDAKITIDSEGYLPTRALYGSLDTVRGFDAAVVEMRKK